jgi:NAD-dependent dihydropyrimidine dehydrogenase PreA subunit/thioredoxin reductase
MPGGMLNQGIPMFRLPREWIAREVGQIGALGVEIRCGVEVGPGMALTKLLRNYDAVIMAAGTLRPNLLPLPGAALVGVEHGLKFLLEVNEFERREVGKRTVVIGGGYTALDCSRTAVRLGAEVAVYYRRGREDMVVLPGEVEELEREGGVLHNLCAPIAILAANGRASGVRFVRTQPGEAGHDGRRRVVIEAGSEFDVRADSVILATGQFPDTDWIDAALHGKLVAEDRWLRSGTVHGSGIGKLFVAGDFALGATTLISAIGHAKSCAREVDGFLLGRDRFQDAVTVGAAFQSKSAHPRSTGRGKEMNVIPLYAMPLLPTNTRDLAAEVERGYDHDCARGEASRCYLCHYKFEILDDKCVLCDECINVKPVSGCIVEISALTQRADGAIVGYEPVAKGKTDSLFYNRLWIDQSQCVRCGECERVCPVNAITIQKVSGKVHAA